MKGVNNIAIFRSLEEGNVLVDITAGTVHPNPINIGTIDFPDRPIFLNGLSITDATLAIYPESSKNDKKKNSVTTIGRNDSTDPIPLKIPFITRECNTSETWKFVSKVSTSCVKLSIPISDKF